MNEARIQKVLNRHRVHADVENLIDDLNEQLEEARELAQHLLDCARAGMMWSVRIFQTGWRTKRTKRTTRNPSTTRADVSGEIS